VAKASDETKEKPTSNQDDSESESSDEEEEKGNPVSAEALKQQ